MDNWHLWCLFLGVTLGMIIICLFMYIYAFIKVSGGSKIKFVKVILALMIISSVGALFNMLSNFGLSVCP
jgi:hypothetical protein